MSDETLFDRRSLADKVEWEGGVFAALRYGIRSEDIADDEVAALWAEMEDLYLAITPISNRIAVLLNAE
jgi:hypothetical protein